MSKGRIESIVEEFEAQGYGPDILLLLGPSGPAASRLAARLNERGFSVSASTIKEYRRDLRGQQGS